MQKSLPHITVIMPVHNRRHLIMRSITSVMNQSYKNWELLVIDDGSTDKMHELIFPLMTKHENIRYLAHAQRGPALSRNEGVLAALGTYITFLDSDDEYKPDHLQKRLNFLKDNPAIDVVHGGVELVGPESSQWVEDAFNPGKKIHLSECTIGATLFGKKDVFLKAGLFKPLPYSAESEFLPRLQAICRVENVNFLTYIYYTGLVDSICTKKRKA